jgi:cytochrome c2
MKLVSLLALALALVPPAMAQDGDPAAGKTVFSRCSSCHDVGENPRNRMGPYLTGVVGRPAASVDGFTYSKPMSAARDAGLVWTPEALDGFSPGPHDYVPGTKMPNMAIKDETQRANLIAYLVSLSPDFDPAAATSTYVPPGGDAAPTTTPAQ